MMVKVWPAGTRPGEAYEIGALVPVAERTGTIMNKADKPVESRLHLSPDTKPEPMNHAIEPHPANTAGSVAEHICSCHQAPVPPDGHSPIPVWVVTTGGDGDRYEVAAAFTDHLDARRYATWWNREETHRYGHLPTSTMATAVAEEIDFYPTGTWRPPTRLR
ncbi:MAG: hypothetical protein ACRDRH_00855 [Pseudonocardia sp.]